MIKTLIIETNNGEKIQVPAEDSPEILVAFEQWRLTVPRSLAEVDAHRRMLDWATDYMDTTLEIDDDFAVDIDVIEDTERERIELEKNG